MEDDDAVDEDVVDAAEEDGCIFVDDKLGEEGSEHWLEYLFLGS